MQLDHVIHRLHQKASRLEIVYSKVTQIDLKDTMHIGTEAQPIRATVLDSSFNPPTRAHLSLALLATPDISESTLLLLSVRNADKQLKPGDAPYLERLEMMSHFADDLARAQMEANWYPTPKWALVDPSSFKHQPLSRNLWPVVLTAAISEPTFVGKSTVLHEILPRSWPSLGRDSDHQDGKQVHPQFQFTFLMGWDTITRFFDPKFYPSPEAMSESLETFFYVERSSIICSRRPKASFRKPQDIDAMCSDERAEEDAFLKSNMVKPYVDSGVIKVLDIGNEENLISSTRIRESLKETVDGYNLEWTSLTTPAVARYIQKQRAYSVPWDLCLDGNP